MKLKLLVVYTYFNVIPLIKNMFTVFDIKEYFEIIEVYIYISQLTTSNWDSDGKIRHND